MAAANYNYVLELEHLLGGQTKLLEDTLDLALRVVGALGPADGSHHSYQGYEAQHSSRKRLTTL